MAVAKRQKKEKAHKNGTKKNPWIRMRTSGEANTPHFWLAKFAWGRLMGWRIQTCTRRKLRQIEASPLGSAHPHTSRVYYPLLAE